MIVIVTMSLKFSADRPVVGPVLRYSYVLTLILTQPSHIPIGTTLVLHMSIERLSN